jgi:hypothetical protein
MEIDFDDEVFALQRSNMYVKQMNLGLKSIIFWDMTPCSPSSFNRCFGGTYRPHLQGRRNKFSKKPASKQVASRNPTQFKSVKKWISYFNTPDSSVSKMIEHGLDDRDFITERKRFLSSQARPSLLS